MSIHQSDVFVSVYLRLVLFFPISWRDTRDRAYVLVVSVLTLTEKQEPSSSNMSFTAAPMDTRQLYVNLTPTRSARLQQADTIFHHPSTRVAAQFPLRFTLIQSRESKVRGLRSEISMEPKQPTPAQPTCQTDEHHLTPLIAKQQSISTCRDGYDEASMTRQQPKKAFNAACICHCHLLHTSDPLA